MARSHLSGLSGRFTSFGRDSNNSETTQNKTISGCLVKLLNLHFPLRRFKQTHVPTHVQIHRPQMQQRRDPFSFETT